MSVVKISIIITTYNRPDWLFNALNSSIHQDYPNIEIIVVNDGSTENYDLSVLLHPLVKYLYQKNQGLGKARNSGLEISNGEYVQFLDDDDWLEPNSISEKFKVLGSNNHLSAVYSDLYLTNSQGKISKNFYKNRKNPLPIGDIYPEIIQNNFIPVHALLWKKSDLLRVNGFPIRSGHEDWETIVKVAEFGKFEYIDKPLGYYRQHSKNMAKSHQIMMAGKLEIHNIISSSNRFSLLPNQLQKKLFLKFSIQNYAFGDESKAKHFFTLAKRIDGENNFLQLIIKVLLQFPPQVSKLLILLNHGLHKFNA